MDMLKPFVFQVRRQDLGQRPQVYKKKHSGRSQEALTVDVSDIYSCGAIRQISMCAPSSANKICVGREDERQQAKAHRSETFNYFMMTHEGQERAPLSPGGRVPLALLRCVEP